MNKILKALFFFIILGLITGSVISFKSTDPIGEKIIGLSVLIGAFIFLPLFLYNSYKDKNLNDYTFKKKKKMTINHKKIMNS